MKLYRPTYKCKITGRTKPTEHYYLRHRGGRYPLHVADRRVAEAKARELIAQLELGFDPNRQDTARRERVTLLVDEFIERLEAKTGEWHRSMLEGRLNKLARELGVATLAEFTVEKCQGWLDKAKLRARTKHHYATHLRQFGRFLCDTGRTPRNPFAAVRAVANIEADRHRQRRALTDAEIAKLVASVPTSRYRRCGLLGPERATLYKVAAYTGLRRNELSSLLPSSFRLDADPPHVVVAAENTKNRREALQPLPSFLTDELRSYLQGREGVRPVWDIAGKRTGQMIRMDLKEAGIPAVVNGRMADFHALRTTFGTRLALANVPLALAQKLMRHSTPVLTAAVYTVAQLSDLSREVEKLG